MTDNRDENGRFTGPNETSFKKGNQVPTQFKQGNSESLKHGATVWLRTGEMGPEHKDIQTYLDDMRDAFIEDLGGRDNLTSGQCVLLDSIIRQMGYCLLIDRWVTENGAVVPIKDKRGETVDIKMNTALSTFYLAAHNSIKRTIDLLGLHKRRTFEPVSEFEQYVQSKTVEVE